MDCVEAQDPTTFQIKIEALIEKQHTLDSIEDEVKDKLWHKLLEVLPDPNYEASHGKVIVLLKILSREKKVVERVADERGLEVVLRFAGITGNKLQKAGGFPIHRASEVCESLRFISNVILQSPKVQILCENNSLLQDLMEVIASYKKFETSKEIVIISLKIIFLITALRKGTRMKVFSEYRGLRRFVELFGVVMESREEEDDFLSDEGVDLLVEMFKCMFNITLLDRDFDEEELSLFDTTAQLLQMAFLTETKKDGIIAHAINLLSNIPMKCTKNLLYLHKGIKNVIEYDGQCMNVPKVILDYLVLKSDLPPVELGEILSPPLLVLCRLSRYHRSVRKYLRNEVLPPLKDVDRRPEEGETPRNKLCKLLTSPISSLSTLTAEFLFVLCKERVSRFIKYTGYGNAAGLLARRGLMAGKEKGENAAEFSDEDEDSDTEEYAQNAHRVNPVVGCVEPERTNIPEMTEEQKEYEAMKLVGLIDKLNNMGIVRPSIPDSDGRPQQVEHLLQLRDGIRLPTEDTNSSDTD